MIKKCPIPYLRTNNIVVTIKPWNLEIYDNRIKNFDGEWHLISESAELNLANLDMINPRFIFFPRKITNFNCIIYMGKPSRLITWPNDS